MNRYVIVTLISLLSLSGCAKHQDTISLIVDLAQAPENAKLILIDLNGSGKSTIDTSIQVSNGSYIFKRPITRTGFYQISFSNGEKIVTVLTSGETTSLKGVWGKITTTAIFYNNIASVNIQKSEQLKTDFTTELKKLQKQLTDTINPIPNQLLKDSLIRYVDTLEMCTALKLKTLIEQNRNLANLPIILQKSGNSTFLSPQKHRQLFIETDTFLINHYAGLKPVIDFHHQLDSTFNKIDSTLYGQIGSEFPQLDARSPWGKSLSPEIFKNKPVLYIFWSATDARCIKELPSYSTFWNKYKKLGLQTVMVNFSANGTDWEKTITKYKLACWHLSDLKGEQSPILKQLGIRSLPAIYIVNKQGIIIEKNCWGNILSETIESIIKK